MNAPKTAQAVEFRKLDDLTPDPANARIHDAAHVELIANSIRRFGWTLPALVDDVIRAGNGRYAAAQLIYAAGETIFLAPGKDHGGQPIPAGTMPALDCSGWTEDERTAYSLLDNQSTIAGAWDEAVLRAQLEALQFGGFPIPDLGFDEAELQRLFNPPTSGRTDPDELPEKPDFIASVRGDLWVLGNHRLKCGDATCAEDVDSVLVGEVPHLMVTDPPYGVSYAAGWRDGALGGRRGGRATGEVQNDDQADWQRAWELFAGDVAYVWLADRRRVAVERSLNACGFELRAEIVWAKNHIVIGRGDYHSKHEPCLYVVRKGKKGHWNGDRKQSTVWDIDKPMKSETGHSTQKPVECMRRPIENNSLAGALVYEPFAGSFTTGIACEMTGRHCRAIEIHPAYVDMGCIRWMQFTGQEARLEATGQTFAEVKAEREAEMAD